jgi:hypothetical protein
MVKLLRWAVMISSTAFKPGPAGGRLTAAVLGQRRSFGCRYGMYALITIRRPTVNGEP